VVREIAPIRHPNIVSVSSLAFSDPAPWRSLKKEGGASYTSQKDTHLKLHRLTGGRVPITGVGGIFNADARKKIETGASDVTSFLSLTKIGDE
jgi:hypothetical protein